LIRAESKLSTSKIGLVVASILALCLALLLTSSPSSAQRQNPLADAPASAKAAKNPYAGQASAANAGAKVFANNCAKCHGDKGQGMGNVPRLRRSQVQSQPDGVLFWYITKGDVMHSMPSWAAMPEKQRWQVVAYLKKMSTTAEAAPTNEGPRGGSEASAPPPKGPFTDYRYEKPGTFHKITVAALPAPFQTPTAANGPRRMVPRPANVWPKALPNFKVELYTNGLDEPRYITTAPNGDFFVAESTPGLIKVFRGISPEGKPQQEETFASGMRMPYGIAFYPPGPDPKWVYIGETNQIVRFPYKNGDLKASGLAEHIVNLPGFRNHWTRSIVFSPDGTKMFVSVGSASNVDDPDTHPAEKDRADVLEFKPDGSDLKIFAYGIRNCGTGLARDPKTGELWCSVNERDDLGDNLVPDYITHVQEGGFYGWPWWYIGGHQDPRHPGTHPELKDKVITPDVLLQPHNASLGLVFYEGTQFPSQYRGDIFAAEHGSWNRATRTGYEIIRVPLHQTGKASGDYEDFVTGFVLPDGNVWGRPVALTVAPDGSLLFTDDGSNSIWRVSYKK